jgi:diguanylate cyclase (GGDEF)-like protein
MNLGAKTTALLASIVFTVLTTASFFWLHYQEESLKRAVLEGLDGQAKMAAHGIGSFMDDGLRDAHAISLTLPTKALSEGRLAEVEAHLKRMFETFVKFQNGIFILDREGKFITDYPRHPELRGQSFAFREYYQRTIHEQAGIVGKPYRSKRTGMPVVTFTAPVHNAKGRMIAILCCSVDLLSPEALDGYRKQKFGNTGYLYIFDQSRQLVLHPDRDRLLTIVEEGKNKVLEAALKGFEGGEDTVTSLGVPMLLAVRRIPNTEWIVGVQVTRKEAYAPLIEARTRIFFIAGAAILLVVVISAAAIRRVSRPLQQLEQAASHISAELEDAGTKGTYDPSHSSLDSLNSIRSRDEIGLLASSFLRLATKLKQTLGSLHRSAEDWERTFNSVHEAVVTLDREGRIVRLNQTAEDWFRTSSHRARGQFGYQVIFSVETPPLDWPDVASLLKRRKIAWSQRLEKPAGIFEFTAAAITSSEETTGAVLVINDVTTRVESEQQVREMAFYDQLTGLPNRLLLQDRIQQAIAAARRDKKKAGIMFIDLDHFKEINDLHGHDVGDEALRQVVKRTSECLRTNDTFSRIGGDEFVIVIQNIELQSEAAEIAERIIGCQSRPLVINGREMTITSSLGIALFPDDGEDGETLLKKADMAMYRAKSRGRNNYQYFAQSAEDPDPLPTG